MQANDQTQISVQEAYTYALERYQAGNLAGAEELCLKIAAATPNFAPALSLLGSVALDVGRADIAVQRFAQAVALLPGEGASHFNHGVALARLGRHAEAETAFTEAANLAPTSPDLLLRAAEMARLQGRIDTAVALAVRALPLYGEGPEGLNTLAEFLNQCGYHVEACERADQAIAADETSSIAWFNRGVALDALGRLDESIASYETALNCDANMAVALNNLGSLYARKGDLDQALGYHQRAIVANPDVGIYWGNLAGALDAKKDFLQALDAIRKAIALNKDDLRQWRRYVEIIRKIETVNFSGQLINELNYCLTVPELSTYYVREVGNRIFLLQVIVEKLLSAYDGEHFRNFMAIFSNVSLRPKLEELSNGLFLKLLTQDRIASSHFERFLSTLRRHFLECAINGSLRFLLWSKGADFIGAVAHQCFLTEYVYWVSPQEKEQLDALAAAVAQQCRQGETPDPAVIALLGCYRPLHQYKFARAIMALPALANHSALKELLRVQIQEPEQERRLRKTIRTLTPINDDISRAVRQQYEENPYPRWVVPRILRCASATEYAQSQTPLKADAVPLQPETPDVLIAGCGSGQQPVEVAISVPLARITAVDLSLTAMAYGMRKAEELGLSNIKFAQADLLELGAWTQRYDMIMCTGVLHHLEQPEKGLDVLLSLLKPGGIMKLALYSETGRQSIVAGRDFIAAKGYAPSGEDIRQCRRDIFDLPPSDSVRTVAERSDFYALSPCRDLLFHVQEHRFTIPQIKALLAERNLRFLGFIYSKVSLFTSYLARFPDNPEADNLDNWEIYEAENPMAFKNMYQFSVTRA